MRQLLLLTALLAGLTHAAEYDAHTPEGMEAGDGRFQDIFSGKKAEIPIPQEQDFQFPEITQLKDWAPIKFHQEVKTNHYYLSLDSLTVGKDNIVRYVITVVPKAGGNKNTLFEGIDCKTNQYRTYAWGNADNGWTKNSKVTWKMLTKNQHNAWQGSLSEDFCKMGDPWPVETIRKDFTRDNKAGNCMGCRNQS
jgi:CNP1-like family